MYVESPSGATKKLVQEIYVLETMPTVLDYGAGNGRNSKYIIETSASFVIAYDPYAHAKPLYPILNSMAGAKHVRYDYILCSFVANVLPREPRESMFEAISQLHYDNLIIEVRSRADVEKIVKKTRYSDGYNTSRGTFQKGFEPADIMRMNDFFGEHGMLWDKRYHAMSFIWREELR